MNVLSGDVVMHPVAETIGWTLVHFTWQAAIIGVVFFALLSLVRRNLVRVRYAICCLGLLFLAATPVVTGAWYYASLDDALSRPDLSGTATEVASAEVPESTSTASSSIEVVDSDTAPESEPTVTAEAMRPKNWTNRVTAAIQPWMPGLVTAWLVGVILLMVRLFGGLYRIRLWRREARGLADEDIQSLFSLLRAQMRVRQKARLFESTRATVPTVIGWLRPVVLVPISMISGLTPAELELVLAHELAHIRRHDYLVNMLQNVLETLLFFHPVVWWLSRQTRIEREHRCDELAIEICNDRTALARALAKMEEIRCADRQLVAASGGVLVHRIRRILQKDVDTSNRPAGVVTLLAIALLFVGFTVSSARATDGAVEPPVDKPQLVAALMGESSEPDDEEDEKESDKPIYAMRMSEVRRKDPKTGIEKAIFPGIRMMAQGDLQVSQEMIYANLFNYSFISERVAKELGAEVLGEVDFGETAPTKAEKHGPKVDLHVHQVTEPVGDRVVRPYATDQIWIPGHLGFYGMNKTKQHIFKIVRLAKVDIGIGPPLRNVNALILNDENSTFGVLGRNWTKRLSKETGMSLLHSADGEMWLTKWKPQSNNQLPAIKVVEQDGNRITRAVVNAMQQSIERRRELQQTLDTLMRAQGGGRGNWSTSRETIVSGHATKWADDTLEANEVTLSVPENTGLRAAFSGERVEMTQKSDHTLVTVTGGQIDLIDAGGVIRARATPCEGAKKLVARVEVSADENVIYIQAKQDDDESATVRVRVTTATGASEDDEVPHGGHRYVFETPKEGDEVRMRLLIRENLDRLRKELGMNDKAASTQPEGNENLLVLLATAPGKGNPGKANRPQAGWGPKAKTGDLRLRLSLVTKNPKAGEPLRLKLELKNVGDEPQKYDPQYYSAFRVLQVTNATTDKSDRSLNKSFQTMGGQVPLAPGETVTLWKSEDATEYFMLNEGTYKIRVSAPRIRNGSLPASNELTVTVAAGRQTPTKRLLTKLQSIAPRNWIPSIGWRNAIYISHQPTRSKRDATTIQLWFTKEPLSDESKSRTPNATTIGRFDKLGYLHMSGPNKAEKLWPEHTQLITDAVKEVLDD